jgi:hypothetical protein
LRKLSPFFDIVPIANSPVSAVLRRAFVQHVIVVEICKTFWQPLSCEALWSLSEARSSLEGISKMVSKLGHQQESIWRHLTLKAAQIQPEASESRQIIFGQAIDRILKSVQPLVEGTRSKEFCAELTALFTKATELWTTVQRDGPRIKAEMNCDVVSKYWKDGLAYLLPENTHLSQQYTKGSTEMTHPPLPVFPLITGISQTRESEESKPTERMVVVREGSALFQETSVFRMGAEERAQLEEEFRQHSLSVSSKRSPLPPTLTQAAVNGSA